MKNAHYVSSTNMPPAGRHGRTPRAAAAEGVPRTVARDARNLSNPLPGRAVYGVESWG